MKITNDGYQDGDIALVRARPALRRYMIYDHAAIIWLARGTWFTIEAGFRGIFPWPGAHWGRLFDVYRPDGDMYQGEMAIDAAMTMIGQGYAFSHLLSIVPRLFRRPIVTLGGMICTELVSWSWRQAGIDLYPGVVYPTPDELYESLKGGDVK